MRSAYASLYPFIERHNYLANKRETWRYRAYMRVYFALIRHYDLYRKACSLWDVQSDNLFRFTSDLGMADDVEELFKSSNNLDDVINKFAREANNMLIQVYREMEIGLCFNDFCVFMQLPVLSRVQILQVQFMLRQVSVQYNVHFFGSELFNIDGFEMLMSDSVLARRLSLVTGTRQGKVRDLSVLGDAVKAEDDTSFLHFTDLPSYYRILVDTYSVPNAKNLIPKQYVDSIANIVYCSDCDDCVSRLRPNDTVDSTLIITHRTEDKLASLAEARKKATFLVTMPVPRTTYRRILKKELDNVFLLSPD